MSKSAYTEMSRDTLIQTIAGLERKLDRLADIEQSRRRAEQLLEASERRYRTLTENVALGLYRRTAGPEGKLVMVNQAFARMFRYDLISELLEMPVCERYWDRADCMSFSNRMHQDREVIKQQLKMKRRDGTPIWVSVTATVFHNPENQETYFDGIMEDISEHKQLEMEQKLRQQQLIQADKMISLGILVSGMAHEINNPNQFIVSNLSPLRRCFDDALPILDRYAESQGDFMLGGRRYSQRRRQIAEMFNNITKGSDRIRNIVDELRDYAREQPHDVMETVHINNVVQSALALVIHLVKKSTQQFFVIYGDDIPPTQGAYQRLEQVLINLIQNACQAVADIGGSISVRTYRDTDQQQVCVEVTDTGVGIAADDLPHITDPFFTTKRSQGGTGLGLSISANIVKDHRGSLRFESEPGRGTTVILALPAPCAQEESV